VPPMALVSGSFKNWKGMQDGGGRRVNRKVYLDFRSIRYTDDSKKETNIGQFRRAVEDFLIADERVNNKMTLIVQQLEATQSGLPVGVCFFLKVKGGNDFEHQLADIMEHIYLMAGSFGLVIYQQYPEQ